MVLKNACDFQLINHWYKDVTRYDDSYVIGKGNHDDLCAVKVDFIWTGNENS